MTCIEHIGNPEDSWVRRQFETREEPPGSGWLWVWYGHHSFGIRAEYQHELVTFDGRPTAALRPHRRMWGFDLETGEKVG